DVNALVAAGRLPMARALALVPGAAKSGNRAVVEAASALVFPLRSDRLGPEELQPQAPRVIRESFGEAARGLGWKPQAGEDDEKRMLRPTLLRLVGDEGEDPQLAAEGRALADAWLQDRSSLPSDLAGAALAVAAAHGDKELFDRLVAAARAI